MNLTEPRVAHTLDGLVNLVARFTIDDGWDVRVDPDGPRAVLLWHHATITVRDLGDLELARFIALERQRARKALITIVLDAVDDLGLPRRPFLLPARRPVNAGLTRCPVCRTNGDAGTHRPGSDDCRALVEERRHKHRV